MNFFRFQRRYKNLLNPVKIINNLRWRHRASISSQPHVFIVGSPRSGTTLMFSIIAAHPAFSAIDSETFFFIPRDAFNEKTYERIWQNSCLDFNDVLTIQAKSHNLIDFFDNIAKTIINKENTARFVEKTPFHVFYLEYLTKHYPNAKFINMIRDGRDGYISNLRLPPMFYMNSAKFAKLWRESILSRQKLAHHPQILDIKYEDLTSKPQEITQKIMTFIGEDFVEQQIDSDYYSKTKIFESMEGHERIKKPIKPTSIGQWKKKMTEEEISVFNRIASRELQAFGYGVN